MGGELRELTRLEELSCGDSAVHRLHPGTKILVTFFYLICVMSLERHAVTRLTPFLFYPVLVCAAAEIPAGLLLRRVLPALPFAVFGGISNLLFERSAAGNLGSFVITAGMLSFAVILFRTVLCVAAVMILIAVTPFTDITEALRRMHVPAVFTDLLEMMYRYLSVLFEEAELMVTAFRLRSGGRKWPEIREYAPLISQLFLRSADRAERIYDAMKCRLYGAGRGGASGAQRSGETVADVSGAQDPGWAVAAARRWSSADWFYFLAAGGSSLLFALTDIPALIGMIVL